MVAAGFLLSEVLQRYRRKECSANPPEPIGQIVPPLVETTEGDESQAAQQRNEEATLNIEEAKTERTFGLRTLLEALQVSERVTTESIEGPFQLNPGEEAPLVCFQFKMSHFVCKAYLAAGADQGTRHLKFQTIFEDNRNGLIEEHRYFMANEWNTSKPYTRLKCGSSDRGRTNVFTLEYDLLCPVQLPHHGGVQMLVHILRMWYTSMVACVMHIVAPRDLPFATHAMIVDNTLSVAVREEDGLQNEACPICLENFQVGDKVRRLPCMHVFHVVGGEASASQGRHCNIDRHLVLDKQCPICKTPIDVMERMERDGTPADLPQHRESNEAAVQSQETGQSETAENAARNQAEVQPAAQVIRTAQSSAGEEVQVQVQQVQNRLEQLGQNPERLPEQAAELERVVRSLQSRWLQIQDVVAGVQQMLHYIEDSQSALSAARGTSEEGNGGTAQASDPEASQTDLALEPAPRAPSAPSAPSVLITPSEAIPAPVTETPDMAKEEAAPLEPETVETAQAAATSASEERSTSEGANWQPFTQAEKVCNAYTWRRRRLGMLKEMAAASSTN